MLVKANSYEVTRDAYTSIVVQVPDYEAKVLAELFGMDHVVLKKNTEPVTVERDEETEAMRLAAKHGPETMRSVFGADYERAIAAAVKKAAAK